MPSHRQPRRTQDTVTSSTAADTRYCHITNLGGHMVLSHRQPRRTQGTVTSPTSGDPSCSHINLNANEVGMFFNLVCLKYRKVVGTVVLLSTVCNNTFFLYACRRTCRRAVGGSTRDWSDRHVGRHSSRRGRPADVIGLAAGGTQNRRCRPTGGDTTACVTHTNQPPTARTTTQSTRQGRRGLWSVLASRRGRGWSWEWFPVMT